MASARATAHVPVSVAAAGLSMSGRVARNAARYRPPLRTVTAAAAPIGTSGGRQVWTRDGRAQIEVRLSGRRAGDLAQAVETAVDELPGVAWAQVDLVTQRLAVRFDPGRVSVDQVVAAVTSAEQDVAQANGPADQPERDRGFPGDPAPVRREMLALAADTVGVAAAMTGRVLRLPHLPGAATAAVVLVDNQPRLRRILERRLGADGADLALALSNAALQAVTQGVASLAVDTGGQAEAVLAAQARRAAFERREAELFGPTRSPAPGPIDPGRRPVAVPPGPVERLADRAAAGSLLAAGGLLALTRDLGLAGEAVLVGAPKAARAGREAFANTFAVGLARRGIQIVDPSALRRLDRVSAILVDSAVLRGRSRVVLEAAACDASWTDDHVWSVAQRLLADEGPLDIPPPRGRTRRLRLDVDDLDEATGCERAYLIEEDRRVGVLLIGAELDGLSDAVLSAAQDSRLRLVLTSDPNMSEIAARADFAVPAGLDQWAVAEHIRQMQSDGEVVAVLSSDELLLATADVGIGVIPAAGRVPWAAHLLVGPGLADVPRLLRAVPAAREVSRRGAALATGATSLGGLLLAVGSRRRGGAVLPVHAAAASALFTGTFTANRLLRSPQPLPVLHTPWHALEPDDVLRRLARPGAPLDAPGRTARPSARATGPLLTAARPAVELLRTVRAELADPLTPVLATGAAASAVIGSPTDAVLVGGVLGANALISAVQRIAAERSLHALLADQRATARRVRRQPDDDGAENTGEPRTEVVGADLLRPGDVIELRAGDVVPADARLLAITDLEVDEASLTGESIAVPKQTGATPGAELPDRASMVFEGTTVVAGHGRAVVVAVGAATEAGRALQLATHAAGPAGMQARLEEITRRGLPVTLAGGAAVTLLGLLRRQPLRGALGSGVSVAVAAVPEGLPLVSTVAQLSAARRLSQRGVLVRSARTVEALGRVDTVCFDKTGTLTEGRLRLIRAAGTGELWKLTDPAAARVLRAAARACPQPQARERLVHATDQAIRDGALAALGEQAIDWESLAELPFQSDRGFSAGLGRSGGRVRLVVKGAPEVLLRRCSHYRDAAGKHELSPQARAEAEGTVRLLAEEGLRVLAVARRTFSDALADRDDGWESWDAEQSADDLTLLGFVGLADAPRPHAAATVSALRDAGIAPVMITGDHPLTARTIARTLGIPADVVVTGPQLAGLDEQARAALVATSHVFARVSPEQKVRIVAALQRAGRTVAMTGDGANDAAAIRLADVGIGMAAAGSTSASNAADLVLTEPDLDIVVDALVEGRAMWRRVRNAVAVLLGGNAGEVGFTLAGTALAGRAPIGTRQFLLVNMLTDLLPAMAIALAATPDDDTARRELLEAGAPSLGAPLLRDIGVRGATTAGGALVAWQIARVTGRRRRADTVALVALVGTQLGQTMVVGGRNRLVLATGLGSALALAAVVQTPGVSQFFGCTPLGPIAWATAVGSAAAATGVSVVAPRLLPRPAHLDDDEQRPAEALRAVALPSAPVAVPAR